MIDFKQIDNQTVSFAVDKRVYNDAVISKVLYALSDRYLIERTCRDDNFEVVTLESKNGNLIEQSLSALKEQLSLAFNDYKLRQIIVEETKDIRTILYVKAFANNDDFEEFDSVE